MLRVSGGDAFAIASGCTGFALTLVAYIKTMDSPERVDYLVPAAVMQLVLVFMMLLRGFSVTMFQQVFQYRTMEAFFLMFANVPSYIVTSVFLYWVMKSENHRGPIFAIMLCNAFFTAMFAAYVPTYLFVRKVDQIKYRQDGSSA